MRYVFLVLALLLSTACTTAPPRNPGDICAIFREKDDWYDDASEASKRWDSPIPVMMSIMYQESRFVADAKPPRKYWLGFIPAGRMSDAYGYPQAKDATWDWYKDKSGNWGADRDDFEDAIDFIGWYNNVSRRTNGIANTDTYSLYLAYHEGHGGFKRRTFAGKPWLQRVAGKVSARSRNYAAQLARCEEDLKKGGWFFGLF
ncbi:MAG: transglycosylase SLT domain-containing protein [Spongiibacter marinus]|uniref:transglycosylase SLT domain-containing protein n=1 Tax=Spongiibacter marinus TaxID=354246 RepID=UPI003C6476AB